MHRATASAVAVTDVRPGVLCIGKGDWMNPNKLHKTPATAGVFFA